MVGTMLEVGIERKKGQMNAQIERRKSEKLSSSPDKLRNAFQGK